MARRTVVDEFVNQVLEEALTWSERFFGPIREDRRQQNKTFVYNQLTDGVPERFLTFIEVIADPKQIVEDITKRLNGLPPPYQIQLLPGEFRKERFDEALAIITSGHIIRAVFGGPENGSRFSQFNPDVRDIYNFLKQRYEAALAEQEMNGDGQEMGDCSIVLREEEKQELVSKYSNAVFSVHLFIRKVGRKELIPGQYL